MVAYWTHARKDVLITRFDIQISNDYECDGADISCGENSFQPVETKFNRTSHLSPHEISVLSQI